MKRLIALSLGTSTPAGDSGMWVSCGSGPDRPASYNMSRHLGAALTDVFTDFYALPAAWGAACSCACQARQMGSDIANNHPLAETMRLGSFMPW